jgi:hypothetical protein
VGISFEWDNNKAKANLLKHKISFEEACTIFNDSKTLTIADPDHSEYELREISIGLSRNMIIIVVSHTDRYGRIRIISARKANKKEQKQYLEN